MTRTRQTIIFSVLLSALIAVVFGQLTQYDFVNYDDNWYIADNPHVRDGLSRQGISWAFTTRQNGYWHPVTWIAHMVDCQLFGVNPGMHHLVNIVVHAANTLLLFSLLSRFTGSVRKSAFVAALFAIHPMHVESVSWIAERKDLLSTFFWLLTLGAYAQYVREKRHPTYVLALVVYAIGLMAKPMIVTAPVIFLFLDFWPLNRLADTPGTAKAVAAKWFSLVLEKAPFLILALISATITLLAVHAEGTVSSIEKVTVGMRLENSVVAYAAYLVKMVWPTRLAVFYPLDPQLPMWKVCSAGLLLLSTSILVVACGRKRPYLVTGWLWYLAMLVPVIGLVQAGGQSMADRYSYLPLVGVFIMLTWGVSDLMDWVDSRASRPVFPAALRYTAAGVLLIALAGRTWIQAGTWRNTGTLFDNAARVTDDNYVAFVHIGVISGEEGRYDDALAFLERALKINPGSAIAYTEIGTVLMKQDKLDAAIQAFNHSLQISPDNPRVHNNIGIALARQGRLDDAFKHFIKVLHARPNDEQAHRNVILALTKMEDETKAIAGYREAMRVAPGWIAEMTRLAWLLATRPESSPEEKSEALRLAEQARDMEGGKDPMVLQTLAAAYALNSRFEDAATAAMAAEESAKASGETNLATEIREQLTSYRSREPLIRGSKAR